MFYEGYNGGTRWGAGVATSSSLTAGWKKMPVNLIDQTKWPNYSDETMFHVATPAIYNINNKWYMYFVAARSGFYINQRWSMWCVQCDDVVKRIMTIVVVSWSGPTRTSGSLSIMASPARQHAAGWPPQPSKLTPVSSLKSKRSGRRRKPPVLHAQ